MSLDIDSRVLSSLPVFDQLEREAVRLLAFQATKETYEIGDILVAPGEEADGALIIVEGKVRIDRSVPTDQPSAILNAGAMIGKLALITNVAHRIQATALDPVKVMRISRSSFHRVLREYPDCAAKIRTAVVDDLLGFTRSLVAARCS